MTLGSLLWGAALLSPIQGHNISRKTISTEPWSSIKESRRSAQVFRSLAGRAIIPKVYQSLPRLSSLPLRRPATILRITKASQDLSATRPGPGVAAPCPAAPSAVGPECGPGAPSPSYPALPRRHRRSSPSGARPALKRRLPLHSCGAPSHERPAPGSGLSAPAAIPTAAVRATLGAPQAAAPPPATPSPPPTRAGRASPLGPRVGHAPARPSACPLLESGAPAPSSRARILQRHLHPTAHHAHFSPGLPQLGRSAGGIGRGSLPQAPHDRVMEGWSGEPGRGNDLLPGWSGRCARGRRSGASGAPECRRLGMQACSRCEPRPESLLGQAGRDAPAGNKL